MAGKSLLKKADVRMILAIFLTGVGGFLIVTGKPLPEAFTGIWGMAMGFYFASRENGEERTHVEYMARR